MYHITWNTTGKTKWVKRLNLLFADENKSGFAFRWVRGGRHAHACERRCVGSGAGVHGQYWQRGC